MSPKNPKRFLSDGDIKRIVREFKKGLGCFMFPQTTIEDYKALIRELQKKAK